jgi:phenylpyruvate tautomerase PptA (4-oxalocrotonate tautomerase family)
MPFIRITVLSPTLTTDQVARLQQGTTQFMATGMRKPIVGIAVLVEHVVSAGWSIAGRSGAVAAHVEAIIGLGTNTTDEKARFIADVWKLLGLLNRADKPGANGDPFDERQQKSASWISVRASVAPASPSHHPGRTIDSNQREENAMDIRKIVTLVEEINSENGALASPALRRVAVAAIFKNPLVGQAAGVDLKILIDASLELGVSLTKRALAALGCHPAQLRAYTKAALVGTGGDLEHGAAMIHPRLGMAMRRTIKRGRVIIPGHAKVGPPGTMVDLIYGPLDDGWDLDAFDSTPVLIHDAPRSDEIVLWIGYATGPRVNARCKGPDQKEVDTLIASFNNS